MGLDTVPIALRDNTLLAEEVQSFGLPNTILALVQTQGTDPVPFFSYYWSQEVPVPQVKRRLQRKLVGNASFLQGMSPAVFFAAADETAIIAGKVGVVPQRGVALREKKALMIAADAAQYTGFFVPKIPARTYSVSVREVMNEIRQHMLEDMNAPATEWSLWTDEEVQNFFYRRVVRFIMETGIIRQKHTVEVPVDSGGVVDLPSDLLDIRRVSWEKSGLPRTDTFAMDHTSTGWDQTTGEPYAYVEEPQGPLSIQLVPPPAGVGDVEIIYVSPQPISAQIVPGTEAMLPVPAAFVPAIKYGTMSDMLMKEGEAHDPVRAQYCEKRYQEGVQLARLWIGASE